MAVAAVNANPQAKAAYEGRTESETKLQELVKKRNAAMDQDSRITSLKGDAEKAKAGVAHAQQKVATERKQLGEAQQRLAQEEQKKHQAKNPPKSQPHKRK